MLIPKENRKKIFEHLFQEGVLVAKKDYNAAKHQDIDVPNLQVIKALQSLNSKGIDFLRNYLALPSEIVPRTFIKTQKTGERRPERNGDRPARAPRAEGGDRDYRRRDDGAEDKKEGAGGDFKPEFKGGVGRGARRE